MFDDCRLNLSKMPGGESFNQSIFYFGFDPKMSGAYLCPNAAAMIRVLALGSMDVVAFDISELLADPENLKVLGHEGKPEDVTLDDVSKFVLEMQASSYSSKGPLGYFATLQQDDAIYIPQGYFLAEKCSPVSSLVFGVRKSFLVETDAAKAAYETAVNVMKASGRDATKMQEVLALYDKAPDSERPVVAAEAAVAVKPETD